MKKTTFIWFCTITLILLTGISLELGAEEEGDKTLSPYFFVKSKDARLENFPLQKTEVSANICGVIAEVSVVQYYQNRGTIPINARYIFPASTRAAVHAMSMTIGDKVIKAKIKEKNTAQKIFNKAKAAGKSASLLKQHRPNVFGMNISNIMPGDNIKIELKYTEFLVPEDGVYEFVYPTVVGPRYTGKRADGSAEAWLANPYLKEKVPPTSTFRITTNLMAGIPIKDAKCPTHKVNTQWLNKTSATITLQESEKQGGNRDYILKYRLQGDRIESGLLLYRGEQENFFLLMAQPPKRVTDNNITGREYIFVVDVSGSMHGFPLNISKELLKNLLGNLRPSDRFNVLLFAGTSALMAEESLGATRQNISQAINFIRRQRGSGGTELYRAMKRAIELPESESFSRSIVIVTDGYISAERRVFDLIKDNIGRNNVFAFGIGSSVNRYLIEGMARTGAGEPFVITNSSEAPQKAEKFREYIQSPVLTNISLKFKNFQAEETTPAGVPDLFAQKPVILFGKWRGEPEGSLTLTGISAAGPFNRIINISEANVSPKNSALKYLWVRSKIRELSDYQTVSRDNELKKEVIRLGLKYNLLTKYTSFIAVYEKIRNLSKKSKDVTQPLPLPKGVSNLAVGGVSSTPEPDLYLLILLILAALFALNLIKKRADCRE